MMMVHEEHFACPQIALQACLRLHIHVILGDGEEDPKVAARPDRGPGGVGGGTAGVMRVRHACTSRDGHQSQALSEIN